MGLILEYDNGQTPIAEEEKAGLKIKAISLQSELDEFELRNIREASHWVAGKKFSPETALHEAFLCELHQRMFNKVWKWAGKFRRTDKNIGVPWYEVPVATRRLCDDTRFWVENATYPPAEIAIRFKHRLVSIHCFPNGNGRHSRIMADLLLECVFDQPAFSWRGSGLVRADEQRMAYIRALRRADVGEIGPLLSFAWGNSSE
ncbi:MAG: mobile mystery protein B [Bacteroidota bacterium]